MKIKFIGIKNAVTSGGCSSCGQHSYGYGFETTYPMTLPSGLSKRFEVGKIETVSDSDGRFLLAFRMNTRGFPEQIFEEV